MATYTLRPSGFLSGTSYSSYGAASNAALVTTLSDNLDSTYANRNSGGTAKTYFSLSAPTIPSTEFVVRAGHFLRYRGGGLAADVANATEQTGVLTYRASDAQPTTTPTFFPDNASVFTTLEVGYSSVSWSLADCATLRTVFYDYRYNSGSLYQLNVAEIGATLYTLAVPTITLSNQTVTTGAKPTIAVSVSATFGWEASEPDTSNMKRVVTEVRIESGGSGVGTGTLLSYNYVDTTAFASGTVNVAMPDVIANGSYTIYARAVRFRDGQTLSQAIATTEQASAWSSATLTMNNSLPTAPTVALTADQTNDRIQIDVTPVTTAGYTSPIIEVQRSDDSGATWTTVRGWSVAGTFGSATTNYDYEAPRNNSLSYRARVTATYTGGLTFTSAWTTPGAVAISIAADWNLKCPTLPSINRVGVQVVDQPSEELTEDLGIFRPLDRRYPVVVAGQLGGWDGTLTLVTTTAAEWNAIKALLESQKVLYLESPFGWSKYIRITSGAKVDILGTLASPRRRISVSYIQVQQP